MRSRLDQPHVHGYDGGILITRGDALPAGLVPARLPRESDRHTVVVAADPALDVAALITLLRRHLPVRCQSIRLVLSESGRAAAQTIADELGLEVIAPGGPVMLLPSGMLFAVKDEWRRFRPGGESADRHGVRQPPPDWERLVPLRLRALPPGLQATTIPAGLWLHDDVPPTTPLTGAMLSVPVDPARLTVVIGRPGHALPSESVHAALAALPRTLRRQMTLMPYGTDGGAAHSVAEWLTLRHRATIDVLAGVDGAAAEEASAGQGWGWRPFAQRTVYRPGNAPQIVQWLEPPLGVATTNGVHRANEDWEFEVIRSGLWLRPVGETQEQEFIRWLPIDEQHPLLVLGAAAVHQAARSLPLVSAVANQLPSDVSRRLRLAVTHPPAAADAPPWAVLLDRFGPLLGVIGPGQLVELPDPSKPSPHLENPSAAVVVPSPTPLPTSAPPPETRVVHAQPESPPSRFERLRLHQRRSSDGQPYLGAAFADWHLEMPHGWHPGAELRMDEAMFATTVPSPPASAKRPVSGPALVIWSVTAVRIDGSTSGAGERVRFPAGSRMRVVGVEHSEANGVTLALLRDVSRGDGHEPQPGDDAVLDRRARSALYRTVEAVRRVPATASWPRGPADGERMSQ
ncbi:hypothetical protein AB0F59_32325 [Micromonospora lupini]|uniref:hypothetical protein n=1 Tax=Micromonospora lupini TaxID=285679 RepID=UPI003401E519